MQKIAFDVNASEVGTSGQNPTLVLVRNVTYQFDVVTPGNNFAIHTLPGSTSIQVNLREFIFFSRGIFFSPPREKKIHRHLT